MNFYFNYFTSVGREQINCVLCTFAKCLSLKKVDFRRNLLTFLHLPAEVCIQLERSTWCCFVVDNIAKSTEKIWFSRAYVVSLLRIDTMVRGGVIPPP